MLVETFINIFTDYVCFKEDNLEGFSSFLYIYNKSENVFII